MTSGAHALPPGLRLGDYEIVSPLTHGGMAAVYLGRRTGAPDAGYVAIKVVHPKFADDQAFVAMFLDESRLSVRIQHPNVVRVLATGATDGLYFMVMEYLHGAPLQLFVRRLAEKKRALKHEVIVRIIGSVAEGLHAAHDTKDERGQPLGIVHRDVTPQNILVGYGGGVKLIDFGIAKAAGRIHQTAKGLLKGKLRYMSPEQAAGRAIDRRTDVYALAIVLWEMLTYRKAFSARTDAELIRLVLTPKLPAPSRLNPAVAKELDGVVLTGLAPSPDERFQTALAFRNALYGAVPAAQRVDDSEIASLLRSVLADELENAQRTLPPNVAVVAQKARAVGAPAPEEQLTQVVPSIEPDDDEDAPKPVAAPAPPPRAPQPAHQRTAFGIGLAQDPAPMPPRAVAVAPTPSPSFAPPAMAPAAAPARVAPPIAATQIVHPDVPIGVSPAQPSAPAQPITSAQPAAPGAPRPWTIPASQQNAAAQAGAMGGAAPPPSGYGASAPLPTPRGVAPAFGGGSTSPAAYAATPPAAFTPAGGVPRPALPGAPAGHAFAGPPAKAAAPSTGARVARGCAMVLGAIVTIGLGISLGWLALHFLAHGSVP